MGGAEVEAEGLARSRVCGIGEVEFLSLTLRGKCIAANNPRKVMFAWPVSTGV